jgi:hypothetical protein
MATHEIASKNGQISLAVRKGNSLYNDVMQGLFSILCSSLFHFL